MSPCCWLSDNLWLKRWKIIRVYSSVTSGEVSSKALMLYAKSCSNSWCRDEMLSVAWTKARRHATMGAFITTSLSVEPICFYISLKMSEEIWKKLDGFALTTVFIARYAASFICFSWDPFASLNNPSSSSFVGGVWHLGHRALKTLLVRKLRFLHTHPELGRHCLHLLMGIGGLFVTPSNKWDGWLEKLALHLCEVTLCVDERKDWKHASEEGGPTPEGRQR
jgi:hypothetical protein